jgi:hypothetical protein
MKRKWHHFEKWECVPAGMYETLPPDGLKSDGALSAYTAFLGDLPRFESALNRVLTEWPISCEQFLSNPNINRIAWLGQASMCIATGVPSRFRAGFSALDEDGQRDANAMADKYLKAWEGAQFDVEHEEAESMPPTPTGLRNRIAHYVETWKRRGYADGLPDEVPSELMRLNLAPSHKAIALSILKNDHALSSLGYSQPVSPWYGAIKRAEIEARAFAPVKPKEMPKKKVEFYDLFL